MDDMIKKFTLVPEAYKEKDPRQLCYHYSKEIITSERMLITYNKYISKFIYYHSLYTAEQAIKTTGRILLPAECLNWRRAKALEDRRIYVGRRSFYAIHPNELRSVERLKLINFLESEGLL